MNATDWATWTHRASGELAAALTGVAPDEIDRMADEILAARRIVCAGMGREGLMMRALCMRLMNLGFDAHMAFDMTTPPVGVGDLLIVSNGPGRYVNGTDEPGGGAMARERWSSPHNRMVRLPKQPRW